ncbi:MAG TPA: argininosuccinate synthase [Candidatus Brocadiia bacterium]|nr:argininosuccinate synthase [Candidatus Brocadiia bacterium]
MSRVVLAYSGGLDTSVAIHWFKVEKNMSVVAFAADLGQGKELEPLRGRALKTGAESIHIRDLREEFVKDFIFPALKANAVYENGYPLHTALGRPLIAKELVRVARAENCQVVAHGCTGKGNDQVRFETGVAALAPDLKVIAPLREWRFKTREEEIDYAQENGVEVPVTKKSPYSIDRNLWGCSIECGALEDPWVAPPADAWQMTADPAQAPDKAEEVVVGFEAGVPVSFAGKPINCVKLLETLNEIGGAHGVGRIDMVEDRVVGIKSREVYEAPAAVILLAAHKAIEDLALSKTVRQTQDILSQQYADLIYSGRWFTDLRDALDAFFSESQKFVTGEARVRLYKGGLLVTGRKSPYSLYSEKLATYGAGDTFRRQSAAGFLDIYSMPARAEGARRKHAQ